MYLFLLKKSCLCTIYCAICDTYYVYTSKEVIIMLWYCIFLEWRDTPLHWSAGHNAALDMASMLIEKAAEVNATHNV